MPPVPVTLLYGGLTVLLVTLLGANVTRLRVVHRVAMDHPVPDGMVRPVRAHGNAAEWVPLGLLLLFVLEVSGVSSLPLHLLGGGYFLGRVLHAAGTYLKSPLSAAGAAINYLVLVVMSVWTIVLHFVS